MTVTVITTTTSTSSIFIQEHAFSSIVTVLGMLLAAVVGAALAYQSAKKNLRLSVSITQEERRNQRLYEGVYRPLLGQIGFVREEILKGVDPLPTGIESTRRDGLFFLLDKEEREALEKIYQWIWFYRRAYQDVVVRGKDIISHEMKKQLVGDVKYGSLLAQLARDHWPTYRFLAGGISRSDTSLLNSLIQNRNPYDLLGETAIISTDRDYDCIIGSDEIPTELAKSIADSTLKEAEGDARFIWFRSVKEYLIKDIESLIKMLERHV